MRNIMGTLMLSQGTPMISHGDEIGRTQRGNNNVYCQDSELSWMDWSLCENERRPARRSPARSTELRRDHPVFRRRRFFEGKPIRTGDQVRDIAWLTPAGKEMTPEDWDSGFASASRCSSTARRSRRPTQRGERVVDDSFLLCFNAHDEAQDFVTPKRDYAKEWTADAGHRRRRPATTDLVVTAGEKISLQARSLLVLRKTA